MDAVKNEMDVLRLVEASGGTFRVCDTSGGQRRPFSRLVKASGGFDNTGGRRTFSSQVEGF